MTTDGLVAEVGDGNPFDELHHKVRPAGPGFAGVPNPGDIRVVHQGQRLPLGLEMGDHLPRIHPRLDDFQGDLATDGFLLSGKISRERRRVMSQP
jgi:hypothetical protein